MLWWLPENGDLIGNHQQPLDAELWHRTLAAQSFAEGLCPTCFLEGNTTSLQRKLIGTGWSNQRIIYYCPVCNEI